jgi:hypothetical protein
MFNASDIVWIDSELTSLLDLKAVGTFRYATDAPTRVIVLAYALGDGPPAAWHADGEILDWDNAPDDLRAAFARGDATFGAWHAGFTPLPGITPPTGFHAPSRQERVIDR